MAPQVEWSKKAADQLDEIVEYIAKDSTFYAAQVATRVIETTRGLPTFPERGAVAPELKRENVREVHVYSYCILYRYLKEADKIRIVGIVHGMRILDETMIE